MQLKMHLKMHPKNRKTENDAKPKNDPKLKK